MLSTMPLTNSVVTILLELKEVLHQLSPKEYAEKRESLLGSSIGMHVRHSLEFFSCLTSALETGTLNYDQRKRNQVLELDLAAVNETIDELSKRLISEDKTLLLQAFYPNGPVVIFTSYFRELMYGIEHAIHHFAMIRVALQEVPNLQIPAGFGFAFSTLAYLENKQ
ncbi:MAG: hypothetical protein K2P88_09755 [Chitinophagaceae bacterium]|nr:hypothetical protein [Chitinophagaceae bacterium]